MKKFLFGISSAFLFVVIFFLIGEVCFRIFGGHHNPLLSLTQKKANYLFEPNTTLHNTSSVEGEFDHTAAINSHGYRGKDFLIPKEKGTLRVFAVGDSFTFGVGAQDNEVFPHLIEENLRAQGMNVEVINAGIGHASPITHYVNLRDLHLQYDPDLVLLFFDLTDLWDDWHSERSAIYNQQGEISHFDPLFIYGRRDWWRTAVFHSAFCQWINNKIVRSFQKIALIGFRKYLSLAIQGKKAKAEIINSPTVKSEEAKIEFDGLLMLRGEEKKDLIDKHWVRTARYLTKIKELLDQRHIPMIIVMYPHGIYVGPEEWNEGRKHWGFEPGKLYTDRYPFKLVEYFARDHAIPFINTLDKFLEIKFSQPLIREGALPEASPESTSFQNKKFFFDHDGHMNPEGNKIVARAVVESAEFKMMLQWLKEMRSSAEVKAY